MLDLIVRGGRVVTPGTVAELDVGIKDGRIATVSESGVETGDAARVIEATGKIVLPGAIEPHAHIGELVAEAWAGRRDVYTQSSEAASRAAVFGGVTTVVDFASRPRRSEGLPTTTIVEDIERRRGQFAGHCYTDFAFHYILTGEVAPETVEQIEEAVQEGNASFKVFTTFGRTRVPHGHLAVVFAEVARHGGIMVVHGEDDDIVRHMTETLKRQGRDQGYNLHLVHNNLSEDIAFRAVIQLATHTGAAINFLHTTAAEGVQAIEEARSDGLPVYGEALHNYLHFTSDDYRKPDGTAIHTYPALKSAEDRDTLIEALLDGRLSTLATDEYTTTKDVKLYGKTIETVCGGHNGIETRVPVAYTKFVVERGMSLDRFAAITATNAAKILGLYPRKGAILPGADADLMLLDPALEKTITLGDLHADSDYSIWEGFRCHGYPVMTILRGKVIVEDGALLGSPTDGQWLRRRVHEEVLSRPVV